MTKLGINIDHVATIREARKGLEPNVIQAALIAEKMGADLITIHLREDRRHIQDRDLYDIKEAIAIPLNLEMAISEEIVQIALNVHPYKVTLVPEKREEITTEGGLDVAGQVQDLKKIVLRFKEKNIKVSLFVDPEFDQIQAAAESGADSIEIHTGRYANVSGDNNKKEFLSIVRAVEGAKKLGLSVYAGHGLNYENVSNIAAIKDIEELNIGHSIISKAIFIGLAGAVKMMKDII